MSRYRIKFKLYQHEYTILLPVNRGIGDIQNGFWVNDKCEWSLASDVCYYIMPHQIISVKKVEPLEMQICPDCEGTGKPKFYEDEESTPHIRSYCEYCGGSGKR